MKTNVQFEYVAAELLRWYSANSRAMPWRATRDPYRIWLSEVMLQQTQVATVIPYYERFLKRFPDLNALAAAPVDDVLKLWAGLGYYSRARNLHRGANVIAQRFGGVMPSTLEQIREVPGIGPYTAGAVLSIAFGLPVPLVDGNVARVLSRMFCMPDDWRAPPARNRFWELAGEMVQAATRLPTSAARDGNIPGAINQALMELGATVCRPRAPLCANCPLANCCQAHAQDKEEDFPVARQKAALPVWTLRAWIVRDRSGRVLLFQRDGSGLFGGLWEVPTERLQRGERAAKPLGRLRHVLSHRVLRISVCVAETPRGKRFDLATFAAWSGTYVAAHWIKPAAAIKGHAVALSSIQRKVLGLLDTVRT